MPCCTREREVTCIRRTRAYAQLFGTDMKTGETCVLCEIRIHTLQYHAYPHRIQMHIATKNLCRVFCTQDHQRRRRIIRTRRWRGVMRKGSAIAAVPGELSSLL